MSFVRKIGVSPSFQLMGLQKQGELSFQTAQLGKRRTLSGIRRFDPNLFPGGKYTGSPVDFFPNSGAIKTHDELINAIVAHRQLQLSLAQFLNSAVPLQESELDYSNYFQYPNFVLQGVADKIVEPGWSDDKKAYAIEQWIIENIEYVSDLTQYGKNEYWALPTQTLANEKGDCEDGAWLMSSLMLHAGIDPNKIFFFGGTVREDGSFELGGHGWIGYKRADGEIVPLDWCFYPTDQLLAERVPLKHNYRYHDDFFVTTLFKTVETKYANWVRNPEDIRATKLAIGNHMSSRSWASNQIREAESRGLMVASRMNKSLRINID